MIQTDFEILHKRTGHFMRNHYTIFLSQPNPSLLQPIKTYQLSLFTQPKSFTFS